MLAFNINNKRLALEILEEEILEVVYDKKVTNVKLSDIIKKFIELKEKTINQKTLHVYKMAFKYYNIDNLSTTDNIKDNIMKKILKTDLNNSSITTYLTYIKSFFNFCVDNKYLSENPLSKITIPRKTNKEIEYYSDKEISELEDYFIKRKNRIMLQLIRLVNNTGLRISEAIEFNTNMLKNDVITIKGKGGYIRHIPLIISNELKSIIDSYENFTPKTSSNYINHLREACNKLEIKKLGFHGIRKSFENRLIQKEIPSDLVAEILGHTPEIQRKHYKKLSNAEQIKTRIEKFNV